MSRTKTYCRYFFNHVALYNGRASNPCCRYSKTSDNQKPVAYPKQPLVTFSETFYSDTWKELRRKAMAGEPDDGCHKCYDEENRGMRSLRQMANEMMSEDKMNVRTVMKNKEKGDWTELLDFIQTPKLTYIEMNLGNYCNLACNICSSSLSTKWEEDDIKLNENGFKREVFHPDTELKIKYNKEDYKDVNFIKFVGGEPMLHPKFISMLDFIIETGYSKNITLQVFTNASWVPKDKVVSRLKQFKKVRISLSIDGTEKVNDYTRHLSSWETVNATAREWLKISMQYDWFQIKWEPTLSVYNANHITEMTQWWIETCMEIRLNKRGNMSFEDSLYLEDENDINIYFNNVNYPKYLAPNIYPSHEEDYNIENYCNTLNERYYKAGRDRNMLVMRELKSMIRKGKELINSKPTTKDIIDFKKYHALLDKQRNKDITKSLPDLWQKVNKILDKS